MKAFTLFLLFFALTNRAMSQINQGQFLAGGTVSFESVKVDAANVTQKTTDFFIAPNLGYFILPKFAAGIRLDLRIYKSDDNTLTRTSFSPFIRYYLLPAKNKVNALVYLSYNSYKAKAKNQLDEYKENGYSVFAGPCIFLNEHVALEFLLGYKQTKANDHYDTKTSEFSTGFGLQIHLGKTKAKPKINGSL